MNEIEKNLVPQNKRIFKEFINSSEFNKYIDLRLESSLIYYKYVNEYVKSVTDTTNQEFSADFSNNFYLEMLIHKMLMDRSIEENQFEFVYFIRNTETGYVKIGKTKNIQKRLKDLERTFPFLGQNKNNLVLEAIIWCPLHVKSIDVEKYFHNFYKNFHINGEWYNISREQISDNLIVDFATNGVLVVVEDGSYNFNEKNSCVYRLMEEDNSKLRDVIRAKYVIEFSAKFGLVNIVDCLNYMNIERNKVYSEDLYKFILNGGVQKLDSKIKNKITESLNFLN